jgi:hypothetical protein
MTYIKVKWIHPHSNEPVWLYSELDDSRWETRKVEVYADGHYGFASSIESSGSTRLGDAPIPVLAEIASNPEFEPLEITKEEFEEVWAMRHHLI